MKEKEPIIIAGLVVLMLTVWLGFLFHQSTRFAGSLVGGMFAVIGTILISIPAIYSLIKRSKTINKIVTRHVSMRTLLAWHIYAGVLGSILVIVHTGHKFHSPVGIALTAIVIIVAISGFIGRYLMAMISKDIKEQQSMLKIANHNLNLTVAELREQHVPVELLQSFRSPIARLFLTPDTLMIRQDPGIRTIRLAETISDLEYSLKSHMLAKSAFGKWLKLHIFLSLVLYALLIAHIWSAIHFGLRWFD